MDSQVQSRSPILNKSHSGPTSPINPTRHQKSISDSAAFDLSMLNILDDSDHSKTSNATTPTSMSHNRASKPKRYSHHSDSSLHTNLSSISTETDSSSTTSSRGEPTPTQVDSKFKSDHHPKLHQHKLPIRTFSTPISKESMIKQTEFEARNPRMSPNVTQSAHPNFMNPTKSGLPNNDTFDQMNLQAWQAHQLTLQHQLLQTYSRLQQEQLRNLNHLGHSRSASHQSTQSTDSTPSISRLPSVLDSYHFNPTLGLNPYLNSTAASILPQSRYQQTASPQPTIRNLQAEIELAEQDLTREADAFNNKRFGSNGFLEKQMIDIQSLQQAAITMAYTGQSLPILTSIFGLSPELISNQPTLTNAINKLVKLRSQHEDSSNGLGPSLSNKKTNLYKTELCRSWEEKGTCRYSSKCQFAHGQDELRPVSRHPKFKTEICRTFCLHGSCPYGKRCCFLHTNNSNESGTGTPQGDSPSSNEPAISRLQQRTSGLSLETTPTKTETPRSRLERLRPVNTSSSTGNLLRSAPVMSRHHQSSSLSQFNLTDTPPITSVSSVNHQRFSSIDRPASALSDKSSCLFTPFTNGHRSSSSSPTELSSSVSNSAFDFKV